MIQYNGTYELPVKSNDYGFIYIKNKDLLMFTDVKLSLTGDIVFQDKIFEFILNDPLKV